MSLGVLNNISALYAENNLNQTQSSLQNVLTQLSSGSRINSGADDAAGLSLANGLQANSAALTQSSTNASEGVGLLQVADGALSQVTSLLNRAVTLATEASNGTLNSSQDAAANQEYQSILSEINNIGSTTTYNSKQVFTGAAAGVSIYTGDSSSSGSSIDNLYFAPLTSSSVGDAGGTVQQSSSGQFVDLSKDTSGALTTAATQGDAISGALKFTITNADGTTSTITTTATTVSGLIQEINKDGIPGVTASFTTAGAVGLASGTVNAGDTGILLTNTNSSVAIAEGATAVTDTPTTIASTLATSTKGVATIDYVAASGGDTTANLSTTDLSSSADAQNALSALNGAISDVAAQRGYIGAQINTLNAVANVETTQQENVTSAENSVMATDYASATSQMSKYEILSQTGISALAQANSMQQLVTKLLQ
ncbi:MULTISPECIES: flagellin [Acidobacterium]|uniref:Flagellin n=1 Tax=Acidobacterium capsulatum (strain ATCC 51196 / DSM 11244 / BCRC 80197 / JCM 7670 / NBRC 15755 / NCIMB 13165 / 161) TaxID=240015 RepID=C1F8I6_ACIC5|nr:MULTISPECIES: flagellin [Acidobacterium]ACO34395.1 flagellin [Acidobacterium capsulatum ATCC 51196]HCT61485.1 flagellin [Acidobacterium sp.]